MTRKLLTILALASALIGLWAGNWETITNTSHVFDVLAYDGKVTFSTWGGVVTHEPVLLPGKTVFAEEFTYYTTGEGLVSNDIRCLEKIGENIWMGSSNSGISILSPAGIQNLDLSLGLPSASIRAIKGIGSRILVATSGGIAEYYYLEGVSFPLLLNQYRNDNTSGGLVSNDVRTLILSPNNYVLAGTTNGISYVHKDSLAIDDAWRSWTQSNSPFINGNVTLLDANAQYLVVGMSGSAYRHSIDPYQGAWELLPGTNTEDNISALDIDAGGTIRLAYGDWDEDLISYTTSGDVLMRIIGTDLAITDLSKAENGLGYKTITRIREESNRIITLGSWGEGFYRQGDVVGWWEPVRTQSVGFPKITDSATDSQNRVWFVSGYIDSQPVRKGSLGISYYDGLTWVTKNMDNSPLHNDSPDCVAIDSRDRVWFGAWDVNSASPEGWKNGVTIYDETNDIWKYLNQSGIWNWNPDTQNWGGLIPGSGSLVGNTVAGIDMDLNGNMFVACYDRGYSVISPTDSLIAHFQIPNSTRQGVLYTYHNGRQYFFGTNNDNGLTIWNENSIPSTTGNKWLTPDPAELSNCVIYGVASIESAYTGWQHWIAASNGLFMWDETDWYKYDTSVKRFIYDKQNHTWDNDQLYYADEERLFGSVRTTPTAIYKDPFGRIWIGTLENGLTMYEPETDRFTNYYQPKDPLLTNYILSLTYEPVKGQLWIGSSDGLNTLKIGRYIKPDTKLESVKAFPNPFKPVRDGKVLIVNLPEDSMPRGKNNCRIYDSAGQLIIKLEENEFARFAWDGKNSAGKDVSSGVYFYVVVDEKGTTKRGKIALIR